MLTHRLIPAATVATTHWCLVLHGLGDDVNGWAPVTEALTIPGLGYVLVQAPDDYCGGFSWFPIPGISDPVSTRADMQAGITRSRGLVEDLIADLCVRLCLEPDRLLLMGFSQGCVMVLETVLRAHRAFAGAIGISGWLPMAEDYPVALGAAARDQQILWTHGTADELLPLAPSAAAAEGLRALGLAIDWRVYDKGHELEGGRELPALQDWIARRVSVLGRDPV